MGLCDRIATLLHGRSENCPLLRGEHKGWCPYVLESRTATLCGSPATSTQLPFPPLRALLRHSARDRSGVVIPHPFHSYLFGQSGQMSSRWWSCWPHWLSNARRSRRSARCLPRQPGTSHSRAPQHRQYLVQSAHRTSGARRRRAWLGADPRTGVKLDLGWDEPHQPAEATILSVTPPQVAEGSVVSKPLSYTERGVVPIVRLYGQGSWPVGEAARKGSGWRARVGFSDLA